MTKDGQTCVCHVWTARGCLPPMTDGPLTECLTACAWNKESACDRESVAMPGWSPQQGVLANVVLAKR